VCRPPKAAPCRRGDRAKSDGAHLDVPALHTLVRGLPEGGFHSFLPCARASPNWVRIRHAATAMTTDSTAPISFSVRPCSLATPR